MAIARITDIRGLVTIGENGEEILKNRDMISEHGGLLTINEFAKIIFDDGREIEVTGPVTFSLDESFFNEGTFEDSITQISDLSSLEYINNNLETIINNENLNSNLLDQTQTNTDIQTEQLNSQITTTNNQFVANQDNSQETQNTDNTQNAVATDTTQNTDTTTPAPETVDPVEVQINDISLVSLVEDTATSGTKVADFNVTGGNIGSITLTVVPSQYFVISGTDILLTQEGANLVNSGQDLPTFTLTASDIESGLSSSDSATLADTTDVDDGLTVTVNNVISSITEGDADTSTVVGNASSTNPDGSTITYTISDTTNYSIDPSTGAITLTAAGAKVVNDGGDLPNFTVSASSTTGDTGTSGEVNPADTTLTNNNPDAVDDGSITTETVTINSSNMNDTNNGFTVTAQNPDGSEGTLSTASNGFGVAGSASGADSELGYKNGVGSEKISVKFDDNVSSVDVAFGWKASTENAVIKFYKDGQEVGSMTHNGGTDGIDSVGSLSPGNGIVFDEVVFSAPSGGDHDYVINSISFEKVTSTITTDEDAAITIDVLANDTDADNDSLTITSVQSPVMVDGVAVGTAEIVNVGGKQQVKFTPNDELDKLEEGEFKEVSFNYTVSDGNGGTDTATVSLKVEGSNDAPTLSVESTKTVSEDGTTSITYSASDIEGAVTVTASAEHGTVVVNSNGTITYTPDSDYSGADTITVVATDSNGQQVTQTSSMNVTPIADGANIDVIITGGTSTTITSSTTTVNVDNDQYKLGGSDNGGSWDWDNNGYLSSFRNAIENDSNFSSTGTVKTDVDAVNGQSVTDSYLNSIDGFTASWWSDSDANKDDDGDGKSNAVEVVDFFKDGGDLLLLQDDTSHDKLGELLGISTIGTSSNSSTAEGENALFDGSFSEAGGTGSVSHSGNYGYFSREAIESHGGKVVAVDSQGRPTMAVWEEGTYIDNDGNLVPDSGSMILVGDVDTFTTGYGGADYNSMNNNAEVALNAIEELTSNHREATFDLNTLFSSTESKTFTVVNSDGTTIDDGISVNVTNGKLSVDITDPDVLNNIQNLKITATEADGDVLTADLQVDASSDSVTFNKMDTQYEYTLNISTTAKDSSESLSAITVSNVPSDATLSAGTKNADGTWTVEQTDLSGLKMTSPSQISTSDLNGITFSVSSIETDSSTKTDSDTATVNVTEEDTTATAPTITASLGTESVVTTGDGNVDLSMDTWSGVDNQYDYTYNNNLNSRGDFTQNDDDIYVKNHIQTSVRTFNGDDEVYVGKNVTSTVNLGDGNNEIEIGNDLRSQLYTGRNNDDIKVGNNVTSQINSGSGNDTVLIGNDARSQIDTGDGDDKVFIGNDLTSQLSTGDDNDTVKIGGNVGSQIDLGAGNDVIQISGQITSQIDGNHGTDSIILDNYTKADYDNNVDNLQTNIHRFENIKFSDGQIIGDSSAFDSIGSSTTTYEYPVNLSVTNNDSDSETLTVKIVVENLPSGATISQNGVEISATNGNEYVLNANDLSNIKISSPTQIASDGAGGLKISVEATSTESNGGAEALQTAVLVDGVVEGAYYETSSGITGYTDANGSFSFKAGDSVTFSVGGVVLGVATAEDIASGKTFLQDIADVSRTDLNDEYLENMAVFLQSIDTADSGDNIVITDAMHEALKDANIDLRTASEEEVKDLVESVGGTYVDEHDAMVHVKEMLQEYANMEEGEFDQRVEDEDNESAVLGKEPQAGIEYTTSSGLTGITNENGEFEYNDGDSITFSKDGVELSTIESSAIGDDALITMNELTSLNQNEIDVDNIELDFDNLASILDIESGESDIKDVDIDDLDIKDMLIQDGENSLSTLLGEDDDVVSSSPETDATNSDSNASTEDEYCPFKTLEESSNGMMTNMDLEDNSTFHDE